MEGREVDNLKKKLKELESMHRARRKFAEKNSTFNTSVSTMESFKTTATASTTGTTNSVFIRSNDKLQPIPKSVDLESILSSCHTIPPKEGDDEAELKLKLGKANNIILTLRSELHESEKRHKKTIEELKKAKEELSRKEMEFENAIKNCKGQVERALQVCAKDADKAERALVHLKKERDLATRDAKSLKKKISLLESVIFDMENKATGQDNDNEGDKKTKEELLKVKDEFATALQSYQKDIAHLEGALHACMLERECAVVDTQRAAAQLQKVKSMMNTNPNQWGMKNQESMDVECPPLWRKAMRRMICLG